MVTHTDTPPIGSSFNKKLLHSIQATTIFDNNNGLVSSLLQQLIMNQKKICQALNNLIAYIGHSKHIHDLKRAIRYPNC